MREMPVRQVARRIVPVVGGYPRRAFSLLDGYCDMLLSTTWLVTVCLLCAIPCSSGCSPGPDDTHARNHGGVDVVETAAGEEAGSSDQSVDGGNFGSASAGGAVEAGMESPPSTRRWAVIASPSLTDSGFPDLVMATLGALSDIELIDREHLEEVYQEQEFSQLQTLTDVTQQLRLGLLLGAQRLLLLDGGSLIGAAPVRIKIVDTYSGTCLFRGRLRLQTDNADAAVERLCELVTDIEKRYADGIRAVVGIPHFVCKSLEDHYEDLKSEYATILASSLSRVPGVTVMSIEETRLIQREVLITGNDVRRFVPLFISGEYATQLGQGEDARRFRVAVSISDGEETLETIEQKDLDLAQSREWLQGEVVDRIAAHLRQADPNPLSLAAQEQALLEQAGRFEATGDFRGAVQLREAALLIQPDNAENRCAIIINRWKKGREWQDLEADYGHCEYLVQNRLVDIEKGVTIAWAISQQLPNLPASKTEDGNEIGSALPVCKRDFVLPLFSELQKLPPLPEATRKKLLSPSYAPGVYLWERQRALGRPGSWALGFLVTERRYNAAHIPGDIAAIVRAMPQGTLPMFSKHTARWLLEVCARRELLASCESIRQTGMPRDVFFANFFQMCIEVESGQTSLESPTAVREKFVRLRELLNDLHTRETNPTSQMAASQYGDLIDTMEPKFAKLLAEKPAPASGQARLKNPIALEPEPPISINAAMTIEKIDNWPIAYDGPVHREGPAGEMVPYDAPNLERLDSTRDVVWSRYTVHLLTKNGTDEPECTQLYQHLQNDRIERVRADGRYVWVASSRSGIHVVSTDGTEVAHFGPENGLPGYNTPWEEVMRPTPDTHRYGENRPQPRNRQDWSLMSIGGSSSNAMIGLIPISPGKCVACGRTGRTLQTWLASLEFDETGGNERIRILHTAGDPYPIGEDVTQPLPEDIGFCFSIPWACRWQNPQEPHDQVLIVGRTHDTVLRTYNYLSNTPLAVDLETWNVTTLAERIPQLAGLTEGQAAVSVGGSIFVLTLNGLIAWSPGLDGNYQRVDISANAPQDYYFLVDDDRILSPGPRWLQIEARPTIKTTVLAERMFPDFRRMDRFAVSACYGYWAMSSDGKVCYRIDPTKPSKQTISALADFVPFEAVEEHVQAAKEIRKLGGYADRAVRCQGVPKFFGTPAGDSPEGTAVCLDRSCQDVEGAILQLGRLHKLTALFLIGVRISKDDSQQIAGLPDLRVLALDDVSIEVPDFQALLSPPRLRLLYLAPKVAGESSGDAYVAAMAGDRCPPGLCLRGPEFTDATLERLDRENLRTLHLWGTSISRDSIEQLSQVKSKRLTLYFESPIEE